MSRILQKMISLMVVACFSLMAVSVESFAAAPTVKIVVSPNKTDVVASGDPLALTAQASGTNLTYAWTLNGPGKLDNTTLPAVFYLAPERIDGKSAQAVITVTVTDKTGQTVTESITIHILPGKDTPIVTETPIETKRGMSTTTKVVLGVGAVAALGGGIALAVSGDDNNGGPFSGEFKREDTSFGADTRWEFVTIFNLSQKDTAITGSRTVNFTVFGAENGVCNGTYSVPVTGTASGLSGVLSWGHGEGTCLSTSWWRASAGTDGGSFPVSLINNNKILRFDNGGWDYSRAKGMTDTIQYPLGEQFVRQH